MFTPFSFNLWLGFALFKPNPFENEVFSNPLNFLINPVAPLSILNSLPISGSLSFLQIPYAGLSVGPVMPDLMTPTIASLAAPLTMRMAAQAGTWIGTWQSTFIAFISFSIQAP